MTEDEKRTAERNDLCSFATGYLYGYLAALRLNSGVSPTLQGEIGERLAYVEPILEKIYELGTS